VLETDRLLLRLPLPEDAEPLLVAFSDPEVMRFIGNGETADHDLAVEQVARMRHAWEADGFGRFVVVRRDDGAVLGRVGVLAWDPKVWRNGTRAEIGSQAELELGWTLARHAWGCGYATEAARAAAEWAFRELEPQRLISLIHPQNERSKQVAMKIGEHHAGRVLTDGGIEAELWSF
jgi:RimJ/RimL family protein N-acetyltransferase